MPRPSFVVRWFTRTSDAALYRACLELRERLLWAQEQPPLTAAAYESADCEATFFAAVRRQGGAVLGTAMLHAGRLRQVVVVAEARGLGVGSALLNEVADAARSQGLVTLKVSAWASSARFYARCGFRPAGEPYESNGIACQKMELPLDTTLAPRPASADDSDAQIAARRGLSATFTASDGRQLHTQTWPANGAPRGVVLYLHGWGEATDTLQVRRLAHALNAAQLTLVAYDAHMHGHSLGGGACPFGYPARCRSNVKPLTHASRHALELAERVAAVAPEVGLVLLGHSVGAGVAMLALERVARALAPARTLRGAVLLAPANHADCEVAGVRPLRALCCPLLYGCGACAGGCPCLTIPREATARRQAVGGEPLAGAERTWLAPCCLFYLPEAWGGLPDAAWWGAHHGGVRYTMVRCADDRIILPRSLTMLRDAAPHGTLEVWPGAAHETFVDVDERGADVDWRHWLGRTTALVRGMLES